MASTQEVDDVNKADETANILITKLMNQGSNKKQKTEPDEAAIEKLRMRNAAAWYLHKWFDKAPKPAEEIMSSDDWKKVRLWFAGQVSNARYLETWRIRKMDIDDATFITDVHIQGLGKKVNISLCQGEMEISLFDKRGNEPHWDPVAHILDYPSIEKVARAFALITIEGIDTDEDPANEAVLSGDTESKENTAFVDAIRKYVLLHGYVSAANGLIKSDIFVNDQCKKTQNKIK